MKQLTLFCFLVALFCSATAFSQVDNDVRITVKEKGKNAQITNSQENLPHFIQFGMMSGNHEDFKNKYNIDIVYQNCVISPFASRAAKENNLAVAKLLTEKYGDVWKKDLGIIPYGL